MSEGAGTLSADVFSHLSRLGLMGEVPQHGFVSMGWDYKVCSITNRLHELHVDIRDAHTRTSIPLRVYLHIHTHTGSAILKLLLSVSRVSVADCSFCACVRVLRLHVQADMYLCSLAFALVQEALFVSLLDRLGRPTLGQYARERRSFQKRPAEARLDRKRWSEETFRGIFIKIVLKDLKDVGFVRILSVDDLLNKRRRSVRVCVECVPESMSVHMRVRILVIVRVHECLRVHVTVPVCV